MHTSRCDRPSRCECSRTPPRPRSSVSHLADARIRAGDEPGLTDSFRYLGSENEVSAIGIGAYFVVHRFFNEVSNAVLGPLPLISTAEVETIHPLLGVVRPSNCQRLPNTTSARRTPSCHAACRAGCGSLLKPGGDRPGDPMHLDRSVVRRPASL